MGALRHMYRRCVVGNDRWYHTHHTSTYADVWYLCRSPTTPVLPICLRIVWYMCRSKDLDNRMDLCNRQKHKTQKHAAPPTMSKMSGTGQRQLSHFFEMPQQKASSSAPPSAPPTIALAHTAVSNCLLSHFDIKKSDFS
jgi:hypothetical protein